MDCSFVNFGSLVIALEMFCRRLPSRSGSLRSAAPAAATRALNSLSNRHFEYIVARACRRFRFNCSSSIFFFASARIAAIWFFTTRTSACNRSERI